MIERLVTIMARLRDPDHGCEWDREQTFATIAPYTIEEAYEVADAIARDDMADLKDELGDLLLQVVFHSRMAEEAGAFALADVVAAISDKMERRHPHIFGDAEAASPGWERIKAVERAGQGAGGRARRRRDRPAGAAARRKAAEARRAHRLRLARCRRAAREDRRGNGRDRGGVTGRARGRESATCCSRWSTGRAISASTPRPRCATPTPSSSDGSGRWKQQAGDGFDALDLDAKEALWQAVKRRAG